ncbi:hypothetical protein [Pseudarthrobacter sp. S6]|uniref:hypothetical protein n=1 Tax=Pseudarthrobacter sp. S6 TaxID=3418420 RepID=UPI003CEDF075
MYFLDDRGVEPIVAAAGQHRLAGGSLWLDMWHYEQRVTVLELSRVDQPDLPAFEDALIQAQAAAKNTFNDNHWDRLAGGSLWLDMWHYEQRVTGRVDQPDLPAFEDALIQAQAAAKNTFNDNHWEAGKFGKLPFEEREKPENEPPQMPWMAIDPLKTAP